MERNIYKIGKELFITSDEEIKEGDYVIQVNFEKTNTQIIKCENEFQTKIANNKNGSFIKNKIILTTDSDLIKDGIQEIDDEFLQWFIKNPTCEFVNISFEHYKKGVGVVTSDWKLKDSQYYKIIIPKEEPKQETFEEAAYKFYPEDEQWTERHVFKLGAKWQKERMYSEEDMREAYKYGRIWDDTSFEEWLEQFKKDSQ